MDNLIPKLADKDSFDRFPLPAGQARFAPWRRAPQAERNGRQAVKGKPACGGALSASFGINSRLIASAIFIAFVAGLAESIGVPSLAVIVFIVIAVMKWNFVEPAEAGLAHDRKDAEKNL